MQHTLEYKIKKIVSKKILQLVGKKPIFHPFLKEVFSQSELDIIFNKRSKEYYDKEISEWASFFKKEDVTCKRKINRILRPWCDNICEGYYNGFIGLEINTDMHPDRLEIIDISPSNGGMEKEITKEEFIKRYNNYYNTEM